MGSHGGIQTRERNVGLAVETNISPTSEVCLLKPRSRNGGGGRDHPVLEHMVRFQEYDLSWCLLGYGAYFSSSGRKTNI